MNELAILLALIFSPLAALSAYLITYTEYRRHFPDNLQKARRLSLNFAISTMVFFIILIILTFWVIDHFLPK
ncbi:MAG: hypothetical protein OP8BY_0066 [Candidatus Saccharicenans subterraneus]|uniref:Uncharacterized protein n=1 Tax=Candidatus Saccharicenans subterraneus TaxID=2508984 RepID=A0A3E2BLU7_9BACT|nr:MAG: hypothetical protein OP8BY_0066 [Candidatus Saccharicenans subterraneum]